MRVTPVLALTVLVLASLVAGCTKSNDVIQDGRHLVRPLTVKGQIRIDAQSMNLFWNDGPEKRAEQWPVVWGLWHDGVFNVATAEFNLSYRVDEAMPVALSYDANLSRENSFNFTYKEDADMAGRVITKLVDVKPESRVLALTWDPVEKDAQTQFRIYFQGTCRASDKGCANPGTPMAVGLEGRFPPK